MADPRRSAWSPRADPPGVSGDLAADRSRVFARGGRDGWREGLASSRDHAPRPGASSSHRGRCATRSPWIVSCPSRRAVARCCSPAPTCRRAATPNGLASEVLERHPGLRRQLPRDPRLEQILARAGRAALPGARNATRRWPGWAANGSGTTSASARSTTPASSPTKVGRIWSHGPRDVMREPAWEAAALGPRRLGLLGLGVLAARRRWEALLLGAVLARGHGDRRPARRLAAAGAGDDPAGRGPGRSRSHLDLDDAGQVGAGRRCDPAPPTVGIRPCTGPRRST